MPRNAWVIQITPVRLTRTTANDASVVRKIYLSIDPIVTARPHLTAERAARNHPESGFPNGYAACRQPAYSLTTIPLIRQQNGRGMAPLARRSIIRLTWLAGHGGAWQRRRRQAIVRKHAL